MQKILGFRVKSKPQTKYLKTLMENTEPAAVHVVERAGNFPSPLISFSSYCTHFHFNGSGPGRFRILLEEARPKIKLSESRHLWW